MEKGKVRSLTGHNNDGTIADIEGQIISFNNSNIVGKDRRSLKTGDQVWFEKIGAGSNVNAINIRRC